MDNANNYIITNQQNNKLDLLLSFVWQNSEEGEEWREIKGTEGKYYISSIGRALSLAKDRIYLLNPYVINGYYVITLVINGQYEKHYIHKLVADAFLPIEENKTIIHHLDQNRLNNNRNNLLRVSAQEHAEIHSKSSNEKLLH